MQVDFSFESLIHDAEFRDWVLSPDPGVICKWDVLWEQHVEHRETIEAARNFLQQLNGRSVEMSSSSRQDIWGRIKQDTGLVRETKVLPISPDADIRQRRYTRRKWISFSVASTVLMITGFVALLISRWGEPEIAQEAAPRIIQKSNGRGQKSKVHLPDGSVVFLNSESTLIYDDQFSKTHRQIELKGEGYFEVARNQLIPFVVKSQEVFTTAIGTAFNINAMEADALSILLVEGKIKVNLDDTGNSRYLEAGQKISYRKQTGFSAVEQADNFNEILWKDGTLLFENTPLPEVITRLEKWYDVEVRATGEIGQLTFSGRFEDEYLSNILKSMAFALDFEYTIEGDMVQLKLKSMKN